MGFDIKFNIMSLKNIFLFAFFGICFTFTSCLKDPYVSQYSFFTVDIDKIDPISHNEATVVVNFNIGTDIQYYDGGIVWSTTPDFSDNINEAIAENLQTETINFNLGGLAGITTYYCYSYFYTAGHGQNDIIYTDTLSFTTIQTPHAPCETTIGELMMPSSPYPYILGPIVIENHVNYVTLKSQSAIGSFEFRFKDIPSSGIYTNESDWTSLSEFGVSPRLYNPGNFTCIYNSSGFVDIHVVNDGNDNIEISFCDMILTSGLDFCASSYTCSGKIGTE
jgi:hypothetical protein